MSDIPHLFDHIAKHDKHIIFKHFLWLMRLIYVAFILLLALIMPSQCQQTAGDWYTKGEALYNQGKYDEAIKCYDEAVRLDPNLVDAWNNKGAALGQQAKYDEAIQACDEAIRLNPNLADAWNTKGAALSWQGKYDEAIKCYDEAIRLDSKDARAWDGKGIVLNKQGKYDETIQACDEAIRLDPNLADAWNTKGVALGQQGKYDESIQACDEAIRLNPNLANAWNTKGLALDSQGKYDEAIQSFDKALDQIKKVQTMPISASRNKLNNESSENNTFKILGIDPTVFPEVKVNVLVNKSCAMAGNLKKENFKIMEDDNNAAIDNFYFTGNASGQKLDLAVVFDDTGSMQPQIDAMKSKVRDLTGTIKASGIDADYSLISFKDSISIKTNWTNNSNSFEKCIDALHATGGNDGPEATLDAIEAVLSMGFRYDAQKVILVITDTRAHYENDGSGFSNYTKDEFENDLKESGAILIPISPKFDKLSTYVDLREIANNSQSNWIDINSAKFVAILEQFKGIITGNYLIEYHAPNQTGFGNRTVLVSVNAPGCVVDKASGSYNRPGSATTYNDSDLAALCWNNKGITFYNQGKYDEAIKAHDEAIRLDPKDADAWYSKGNALGQQGKYGDAVKAYDKAIEINPKNSWAWYRKGKALNAIGRTNESNAAFAKAKELGGHK